MKSPHARVPLVAFGLAAVGDLVSLAAGYETGHAAAKPLLMPLLAAYARACGAPRLLVVALLFGWGGDVLLLFDAEPAFLAGMASFAAGHVCYLLLFGRTTALFGKTSGLFGKTSAPFGKHPPRARATWLTAAAYALALVATVALLWPGLPADLRVPVAGYSLLLTAMAYGATRLGLLAGVGGALFMLSDTLIATGVADWPQLPRPDLWIMLTYLAAQFLLARGVLGVPGGQAAPPAAYRESRTLAT
ncbi:lysoplasmalogenase [Streptomyces sp. NBC_00878]|uniref:lysoplasmalogenase n=1 Tax=Streptomyces sp. NBC_00878 TaxID=2975854 RepID=UPI00225B4C16|nr:lysoplasmalogenase [Streptomyces sp. NBC_00878]MCX4909839.1 lysoplasmalogenase [Streptomyces sp. NBC_00878]